MGEDIALDRIILGYFCLLLALSVHEAAHALVADWRGDPSPRLLGRVTLNPIAHIDIIGTIVMPLVMMIMPGGFLIGWAKPVSYNPVNLKDIRRDPVLIALAGPAANLLLALGGVVALRVAVGVMGIEAVSGSMVEQVLGTLISLNLLLMLFNMLPVPPLDGHYVLHYFLPQGGQRVLESIGPFGIIIALVLVAQTGIIHTPLNAMMGAVRFVATWGAL